MGRYWDKEAELKQLLEEYGMEESTDNGVTYVWYRGSDLKAEGLAVEAGSRKETVDAVLDCMHRNPQWKIK